MNTPINTMIKKLLKHESAGGMLLVGAAFFAILMANTPFNKYYNLLIDTPVAVQVGALEIAKPLLLWVNDGLMAVFFFLIGLELKREFLEGELSNRKKITLPALGAVGGMAVPAVIYTLFNYNDSVAMQGWAIPAATDIAFALGVFSMLGSRAPNSLKVFLTSLAIFDDIGAILIIAFFYTSNISLTALVVAAFCVLALFLVNRRGIADNSIYIAIGLVMWVALLKSGVHATLAGVVLAMFIPNSIKWDPGNSPLKRMENDLHATVAYLILPFFAFCNAGIDFHGMGPEQILHDIPIGIALGLFLGNQIGVFSLCWLGIKLRLAELPGDMTWLSLYGTAMLCGIGFTMSLFIGSLAFEETGVNIMVDERLGILVGSLLSGIGGFLVLKLALNRVRAPGAAP